MQGELFFLIFCPLDLRRGHFLDGLDNLKTWLGPDQTNRLTEWVNHAYILFVLGIEFIAKRILECKGLGMFASKLVKSGFA
jgi:hypothetical protein